MATPRYRFVQGDICDAEAGRCAGGRRAAGRHRALRRGVARGPQHPLAGTGGAHQLPTAPSRCWKRPARHKIARFVHVSTDEVYGSLEAPRGGRRGVSAESQQPVFGVQGRLSDLLARSYFVTYKLPVVITRASNNYGPYQFPEKLIPLMIANALEDRSLPVYGDGQQVRDWLYVDDHCRGILAVLRPGPRRRDLQHRRQPLAAQSGSGAPGAGAHRQAARA